jgi:hypothetical protein
MSAEIVQFPKGGKDGEDHEAFIQVRDSLPFFQKRKRGLPGSWWSATPSDNFQADMQEGRRWATLFLPMLRYNAGSPAFAWIIGEMIKVGEPHNGLVSGFVQEIAHYAAIGGVACGDIDLNPGHPA